MPGWNDQLYQEQPISGIVVTTTKSLLLKTSSMCVTRIFLESGVARLTMAHQERPVDLIITHIICLGSAGSYHPSLHLHPYTLCVQCLIMYVLLLQYLKDLSCMLRVFGLSWFIPSQCYMCVLVCFVSLYPFLIFIRSPGSALLLGGFFLWVVFGPHLNPNKNSGIAMLLSIFHISLYYVMLHNIYC